MDTVGTALAKGIVVDHAPLTIIANYDYGRVADTYHY